MYDYHELCRLANRAYACNRKMKDTLKSMVNTPFANMWKCVATTSKQTDRPYLLGEPLFSSHMIDLSEETVEYNLDTTAKYFERAAKLEQW